MKNYKEFMSGILLDETTIQQRIKEIGLEIARDYADKPLLLVCILKGGVIFLTDLIRAIPMPVAVEFMAVSSYNVGTYESSGNVRITLDLNINISQWHVLLVEDIIDSGYTLASVLDLLSTRKPLSLAVCTLLNKSERRKVDIPVLYSGFDIPNEFVFGYGLDIDEYFRNLPFIGTVDMQKYKMINQ